MARPLKDGVDYFPKDTDFYEDDKVRLLRAEFGSKGMYLLDYILCDLYGKNGYFIKWDKNKCYLVSDGAGCGCSPEFVAEFISGCIRCSFFDKRVFEMFGALTSVGIQRRFIRMLNSRENFTFIEEYFLLDTSDKKDVPQGILNKLAFKKVSDKENEVKSKDNPDKSKVNSQSRIEENKVKENRVEESRIDNSHRLTAPYEQIKDMYNSICTSYPQLRSMSDNRKKAIKARLRQYSIDDFKCLFEKAENSSFLKGANNRNWSATFDWLIKDSNMAKTLDGNYDDRPTQRNDYGERNNNPFFELINNGAFENGDDML